MNVGSLGFKTISQGPTFTKPHLKQGIDMRWYDHELHRRLGIAVAFSWDGGDGGGYSDGGYGGYGGDSGWGSSYSDSGWGSSYSDSGWGFGGAQVPDSTYGSFDTGYGVYGSQEAALDPNAGQQAAPQVVDPGVQAPDTSVPDQNCVTIPDTGRISCSPDLPDFSPGQPIGPDPSDHPDPGMAYA